MRALILSLGLACGIANAAPHPSEPRLYSATPPAPEPRVNKALKALLAAAEDFHFQGRFRDAHETLAFAEKTALRGETDPGAHAKFWVARGNIYLSQTTAQNSGYPEAEAAAKRAIEFAEKSNGAWVIADAYELAGRIAYSRRINLGEGDYEAPLDYWQKSLTLRRKVNDTRGVIESLFRVGLIHERKDQSEKAIALYQEALRTAGEKFPLERSNAYRHLAYQRQGQGDFDTALRYFEQSLALREEAGFVLTRSPALNSIGDLYRRMKNYERALEYNQRAFDEAEKLGAPRFMVMALISIGETQAARGETARAIEHWRRAERLAGQIGYTSGRDQARDRLKKAK